MTGLMRRRDLVVRAPRAAAAVAIGHSLVQAGDGWAWRRWVNHFYGGAVMPNGGNPPMFGGATPPIGGEVPTPYNGTVIAGEGMTHAEAISQADALVTEGSRLDHLRSAAGFTAPDMPGLIASSAPAALPMAGFRQPTLLEVALLCLLAMLAGYALGRR